jgi:hypothetical protein
MSGYYEPEFSGCECCNPDEHNEDDTTRVWRWSWWLFQLLQWRERRRLDRWIDKQVALDAARDLGEEKSR